MTLLEQPHVNGIINLGTGESRTWNDAMHAVFAAMGRDVQIEYVDMPDHLRHQYQNYTQADMQTLRSLVPTASFRTLEESVADYVQRHLMGDRRYY